MMTIWELVFVSAALLCFHLQGIDGVKLDIVIPEELEIVNGSSQDMGCVKDFKIGLLDVCNCKNYMTDGISPDIDTRFSNWASQLVTVRRNEGTPDIPFAHVMLTFGFEAEVHLNRIEMDIFHCPEWKIGAPSITVYPNPEYDLTPSIRLSLASSIPSGSSCNSLSTVQITGDIFQNFYRSFYILVDLSRSSIRWVHIGEVRFLTDDLPITVCPELTTTITMIPSSTPVIANSVSIPASLPSSTTALSTMFTDIVSMSSSVSLDSSSAASQTHSSDAVVAATSVTMPGITFLSSDSATSVPATYITSVSTVGSSHLPPQSTTEKVFFPSISVASTTKVITDIAVHSLQSSTSSAIYTSKSTAATSSPKTFLSSETLSTHAPSSPSVIVDSGFVFHSTETSVIIQKTIATTVTTYTTTKDRSSQTLPSTTETLTSTVIPVPPTKDIRSLVAALITIGVLITTITLSAIITIIIVLVFRKKYKKVPITIESYIEIGPLAPVRMDVPADEDDFGVHKVPLANGHENGNIYEIAK